MRRSVGHKLKSTLPFGLFTVLLAGVLLSNWFLSTASSGGLRMVAVEIQAASRDAGTQWMVVACLLSYFVTFLILARRMLPQSGTEGATGKPTTPGPGEPDDGSRRREEADTLDRQCSPPPHVGYKAGKSFARLVPFCGSLANPDFWLVGLVALVLLRYAVDYADAAKSLQVVVLLTGIVMGKGVALWAGASRGSKLQGPSCRLGEVVAPSSILHPRSSAVLVTLTLLLAALALWQPEMGMEFHYRGIRRWEGVWENPNTYGLLMGVGVVLAVGLLMPSSKSQVPVERSGFMSRATRHGPRLVLLVAAALCGFGLLKSYSRGAWLGTAVAVGYLVWRFMECGGMTPLWGPRPVASGKSGAKSQQSKSWLIPSSILLLSILVICFWQFRHTEAPLVRRVFSVGNVNDFSWRNRVTAWQGAGRMMLDKPMAGFGWGQAEEAYRQEYRAERLEETAAIQLNDYLMLATSAGVPALVCLLIYVSLAMKAVTRPFRHLTPALAPDRSADFESAVSRVSNPPAVRTFDALPIGNRRYSRLETCATTSGTFGFRASSFGFPLVCAAGAMVLLIGFWFDGGLFKLPTAVVFWVLLELARSSSRGENPPKRPLRVESSKRSRRREEAESIAFRASPPPHVGGYPRQVQGENSSNPDSHFESQNEAERRSPDWLAGQPDQIRADQEISAPVQGKGISTVTKARGHRALRWLAGLVATLAIGLTALHLALPQCAVSPRTLSLARQWLVPTKEQADFEFLIRKETWSGKPVTVLLQHAHLAGYNRDLVNWKLEDSLYQQFVLSPGIDPAWDGNLNWRRPLWEYFYPRIRKETSLAGAVGTVTRQLRERVKIVRTEDAPKTIAEMWRRERADERGLAVLAVAALRSVGISTRLSGSGQAEYWNDREWSEVDLRGSAGAHLGR